MAVAARPGASPDAAEPDASPDLRTVEQETLDALARQARVVPAAVALNMLMVASVALGRIPFGVVAAWYLAVLGMQVVRGRILPSLAADHARPGGERLRTATLLSVVNGSLHASSVLAFPWMDVADRAVVTIVLLGMAIGTIGTSAGWRPVFYAYCTPVLLGLAAGWALADAPAIGPWVRFGLVLATLFQFVLLRRVSIDMSGALRRTYAIRHRERALRRDLVDLNEQLRVALDQAQAANRAKTRFLASASHDLRQPLHALLLFTAALSIRKLDAKSHEIAAKLDDATQALAHELDTLLDVSKLDAGIVRVNLEALDPGAVAAQVVETLAPIAQRRSIAMRCEVEPGLVVETDRVLLERIVRNLVDNAVKYTEHGSVSVTVRRVGAAASIEVADTGRGIPEDERERIFEEFYQLDNPERDRQRGLGLGLAIVRRLADLLGGRLRVESAPGRGSTFALELPLAASPAGSAAAPVDAEQRRSLAGLHVLVVDDEASVRLGTRLLLEGLGCDVDAVQGTPEALAALRARCPDIVLADFRLRGEDSGVRTIRALREVVPQLPALLISGDTAPERLREAQAAGVALLHKPVPAELLTRSIVDALGPEARGARR